MKGSNAAQPETQQGRFTVADLERLPLLVGANEFANILNCSCKSICAWHKRGLLKRFEVKDAFGPKRWSGILIRQYLETSATAEPVRRFFGSARKLAAR